MADLRFHKVTTLPVPAEPNAVYYVEVAPDKFDVYVTDSSGNAHSLNVTPPACCLETKVITTTPEILTPDSKNFIDAVDPPILTLPPTFTRGSVIEIVGIGPTNWRINQNAGQVIYFNNLITTTGVTGYIESSEPTDSITLLAVDNNYQMKIVNASSYCINLF